MTTWAPSSRPDRCAEPEERAELASILAARDVHPVFQPVVDLRSGQTVGLEALSRGPTGSALHGADRLFGAASRAGRLRELDRLCRARALEAVVASGLQAPHVVFVNHEPGGRADAPTAEQLMVLRRRGVRTVIELTERDLGRDPAHLLAFADRLRAAGIGIALDDVGVDADSLALMPFLMPDVIKLDMGLLHRPPDLTSAGVLSAVRAHAERRGTLVLAEGVETPEHERMAVAVGATLGQGWLYGRPAPLATSSLPRNVPSRPLVLRDPEDGAAGASPFAMVTRTKAPVRAPVDLLFTMRLDLEARVAAMGGLAVVLLSCIDAPDISAACASHYAGLAASARFVAALGARVSDEVVPGLRGARVAADDPVASEWNLVVVSPHFAAAVVAKERNDALPDEGRAFDYVLTYERDVVVDVARSLMRRALPLEASEAAVLALLGGDVPGAEHEP